MPKVHPESWKDEYPEGEPSRDFEEMFNKRFNRDDREFDSFQTMLFEFGDWQYRKKPVVTKMQQKSLAWIAKHKLGLAPITTDKKGRVKNVLTGKFTTERKEVLEIMGVEEEKPRKQESYYDYKPRMIKTRRNYDVVYIDEPLKNPQTGRKEYWGMNYRASKDLGVNWVWGENTLVIARGQNAQEYKETIRHETIEANYYKANPNISYETAHRKTTQIEKKRRSKYG